jgi:hypothetical protein
MSEQREREYPLGTIREWQSGSVIKFDNQPNTDNWMGFTIPDKLNSLINQLKSISIDCQRYKKPLDGDVMLDMSIEEFYKKRGVSNGQKQFRAWNIFGGKGYAFREVFCWKYIRKKAEKRRVKKYEELNKENPTTYSIYSEKDVEEFDMTEVEGLLETLNQALTQLKKGVDFEGEEKELYQDVMEFGDLLPLNYRRIGIAVRDMEHYISKIKETFPHNWALQKTIETYLQTKFEEYKSTFKNKILRDEASDQEQRFGVKIDAPAEEFYSKLRTTIFQKDEPEDIKFNEIMFIRWNAVLGLRLDGEWKPQMIPALENMEYLLNTLPEKHFKNNHYFKGFVNHDYNAGEGYAYYNPKDSLIGLSAEAIAQSSIKGLLTNREEFVNVVSHEVGHVYSKLLRDKDFWEYKMFRYLTGWDNTQSDISKHSTAGDEKVERRGSKRDRPLITTYCSQSPEEAFAEYYSFYTHHKENIDKWLDTGDTKPLQKVEFEREVRSAKDKNKFYKLKEKGLTYRDIGIPTKIVVSNKDIFQHFRTYIFGNKRVLKAFENLGII